MHGAALFVYARETESQSDAGVAARRTGSSGNR